MTYEEAIEILQEERNWAQQLAYVNNALDMAIEALKMQIPEEPYWRVVEGDVMEENIEGYACPICDIGVTADRGKIKLSRCSNCGKALDWGLNFK